MRSKGPGKTEATDSRQHNQKSPKAQSDQCVHDGDFWQLLASVTILCTVRDTKMSSSDKLMTFYSS